MSIGQSSLTALLMAHLGYKVKDKCLLRLIKRYLRAGVLCKINRDNQFISETREGGPLSSLLTNIMLDSLDKELDKRRHQFAAYADDFSLIVKSLRTGERYADFELDLNFDDNRKL